MPHAHRTACYIKHLRADPTRSAPALRVQKETTPDDMRLWKQRSRAFDAARLALKLTTPKKLQRANSAVTFTAKSASIRKFSVYG
jgi:hypothetical protein